VDIRTALKEQYHAAMTMLADCIDQCPDDLWATPNPRCDDGERVIYRSFWRIAFHAAYFTHLYLGQSEATFNPGPTSLAIRKRADLEGMWQAPWDIEPFELPENAVPSSRQDILEYINFIKTLIDPTVNALDLETEESGFAWYTKIGKLSHQLMSLRHIQGHVGQLSELLLSQQVGTNWVSKGQR
jgi:hypothetical protein